MDDAVERPLGPDGRRAGGGADGTVALVLLGVLGIIAFVCFQLGALVGLQADACAAPGAVCDASLITVGVLAARWVPLGLFIVALVVTVFRLIRGRLAFPVPLIAIVVSAGIVPLASAVVDGAITAR